MNAVKPEYNDLYRVLINSADRGEGMNAPVEHYFDAIYRLANEAKDIFLSEPPLIQISPKVTICGKAFLPLSFFSFKLTFVSSLPVLGDIHGQFYDLLRLLNCGGQVGEGNTYLFLG